LPVFRFRRAFHIARGAKVFLNLESGVTRKATPDVERVKRQAEDLRNAKRRIKVLKEALESKSQEIFQLKTELRAAMERVESDADGRPALPVASESKTGALPDFVIIGGASCGTSFLYHLLTRHPYVERTATLKEVNYFGKHFDKGLEWYKSQFLPPRWKDGRRSITGETTPRYLYHPLVPKRMAKVVPQAHLIALLRNPVDRAYSEYNRRVRDMMRETRSFEEAIEAEKEWLLGKEDSILEDEPRPPFVYLKRGIYVDHLLHWSKFFSKEQMLVLKSEDFFARELKTLQLVLDFLDLPDWKPEVSEIHNTGHFDQNKGNYDQKMNPATRKWLESYFEPHNQRLYEHLGVDFGW
jgi:Sulfotransferase domain